MKIHFGFFGGGARRRRKFLKFCSSKCTIFIAKPSENVQRNPKISASGEVNFHRR